MCSNLVGGVFICNISNIVQVYLLTYVVLICPLTMKSFVINYEKRQKMHGGPACASFSREKRQKTRVF